MENKPLGDDMRVVRQFAVMALSAVFGWADPSSSPPTLEAWVQIAERAELQLDPQAALVAYEAALQLAPGDARLLQKVAQQLSDLTPSAADVAEKRELATRALAYAERALALAPDEAVNVLSVAICRAKLAEYGGIGDKLRNSPEVKMLAERAVLLDANYDWAHHVLGRWHQEVAALGRASRWFLKLVPGDWPPASHEKAIWHLSRAAELAPQRVPHRVELGVAYLGAGRAAEARRLLMEALAMPSVELHDEAAKKRAKLILARM